MAKKLEGKIAVITGGNSGIGLETARLFKAEGARLAIFGRNQKELDKVIQKLGGEDLGFEGDVTYMEDLDLFFQKVKEVYGRVDILFVNAGISKSAGIAEVSELIYDEMFAINVKGVFYTVQKALPLLQNGSAITITTSNVIHVGYPNLSVYTATKSAIRGFARSFAAELLERGIRVNTVSPGPIETTLLTKNMDVKTHNAVMQNIAAQIPMKRMGRTEEIAKAVLFLSSDDSSFMTGTEVVIDGGGANIGQTI